MSDPNLAGPVADAEAASPLQQALFGTSPTASAEPQPDLGALAPVYHAAMADFGIRQPPDAYLPYLILPLVRFFRQRLSLIHI